MVLELPVTSDIGTKIVTPVAVTPCPGPYTPRGGLSSFVFHWRSNPGFESAGTEILSSAATHDVRWAFPSAVSHCVPVRPIWPKTTVVVIADASRTTIKRGRRISFSDYRGMPKQ